jgi:hypothetical protein
LDKVAGPERDNPVDAKSSAASRVEPFSLRIADTPDGIRLTWNPLPAASDISGYYVYRGISGGEFNRAANLSRTDTTYLDQEATGFRYAYWVMAVGVGGSVLARSDTVMTQEMGPEVDLGTGQTVEDDDNIMSEEESSSEFDESGEVEDSTGDVVSDGEVEDSTGDVVSDGEVEDSTGDVVSDGEVEDSTGDVVIEGEIEDSTGDVVIEGEIEETTGDVVIEGEIEETTGDVIIEGEIDE